MLHWPMEEVTGFTLEDAAGNAQGNLAGRTTRVVGKIGQAIEFDGVKRLRMDRTHRRRLSELPARNSRTISLSGSG